MERRDILDNFEAVYENGVLRPLELLPLAERERVWVTVRRSSADPWIDEEFMAACAGDGDPSISVDQVRAALSRIHGSMDEAIDQQRGER